MNRGSGLCGGHARRSIFGDPLVTFPLEPLLQRTDKHPAQIHQDLVGWGGRHWLATRSLQSAARVGPNNSSHCSQSRAVL